VPPGVPGAVMPPLLWRLAFGTPPTIPRIEGPQRRPPKDRAPWRWVEPGFAPSKQKLTPYTIRSIVLAGTTGAGSAGTVATAAAATTAGDNICFIVSTEDSSKTLTSVISSTGDTCTLVGPLDYNGGANRTYIAYKIGITGNAADVWTATWSAAAIATDITGFAWAGGSGGYVTSVKAGGGASTALNSGAVSTSNPYALLLAFGAVNNAPTFTMGNGFDLGASTNTHTGVGYKIQDRTGSYAAAMTSSISDTWACWVVEFAPGTGITAPNCWKQGQGAVIASTTSVNVAYPGGLESGNGIFLFVTSKHANAPSTPGGWTLLAQVSDGSGSGVDTGQVTQSAYFKESVGTESGTTQTVSKTTETGTAIQCFMVRVVKSGGAWVTSATTGADATIGTDVSVTGAANLFLLPGDLAFMAFGDVSDVGTSLWGLTGTAAGSTFDAPVLVANAATSQGDDMRTVVSYSTISVGPSTAAPAFTGTANGTAVNSHRGAGVIILVRALGMDAGDEWFNSSLRQPVEIEPLVTVYDA
jgi:hypothetical protein